MNTKHVNPSPWFWTQWRIYIWKKSNFCCWTLNAFRLKIRWRFIEKFELIEALLKLSLTLRILDWCFTMISKIVHKQKTQSAEPNICWVVSRQKCQNRKFVTGQKNWTLNRIFIWNPAKVWNSFTHEIYIPWEVLGLVLHITMGQLFNQRSVLIPLADTT